jgi:hypothetical protein
LEQTTTGGERKGKVTSGKAVASAGLVPFVLLPIQPLRGANLSRSEASSETTGSAGGRLFLKLADIQKSLKDIPLTFEEITAEVEAVRVERYRAGRH